MKITCVVLIINEYGKFLICHPTGGGSWSLPKGIKEDGESPVEAAIREVKEETGINLSAFKFKDFGQHSFRSGKDIHIFSTKILDSQNLQLRCDSYFEENGKQYPEVDNFKWANWNELSNMLHPRQFQLIAQAIFEDKLNLTQ